MAFSYSDENFTVIGNLCFVHFYVKTPYTDIPPAIADRMLLDDFHCTYTQDNKSQGTRLQDSSLTILNDAHFKSGKINCTGRGYLYCYFPIDSNK